MKDLPTFTGRGRFCGTRQTRKPWNSCSASSTPSAAQETKRSNRGGLSAASRRTMSTQNVKVIVQEKYGEAARRVMAGQTSSCCGASACCGADVDPITSDLYDEAQKSGLPQE